MRAELRKVVSRLGEGDVLMVTRLDRLARSTRDLLNTLDEIAKRGAGFKLLRRRPCRHDRAVCR
jgi:DNA invertase Pin-like site-specific DNA recombinase